MTRHLRIVAVGGWRTELSTVLPLQATLPQLSLLTHLQDGAKFPGKDGRVREDGRVSVATRLLHASKSLTVENKVQFDV